MISNLQDIYINPANIHYNDNAGQRKNVYDERINFFQSLYNNGFQMWNTYLPAQLGQINWQQARGYFRNRQAQIPSLAQFKYYFLPALLYDEQKYEDTEYNLEGQLLENTIEDLQQNSIIQIPMQINPPPLNFNNHHPQNPFPAYIRKTLAGLIQSIQEGFRDNRFEKVFFNVEILYSDLPFHEFDTSSRENIIRYQRAWASIDKQIYQLNENNNNSNLENQQLVERQQFNRDGDNNNLFSLAIDNDINKATWFKKNYNIQFLPEDIDNTNNGNQHNQQEDSLLNNMTYWMHDNPDTTNAQLNKRRITILQIIYGLLQDIDIYELYLNATFIRSVEIFAIKKFTRRLQDGGGVIRAQIGVNIINQPYVINNTLDDMLDTFLNGLSAFYSQYKDKLYNINQYDIVQIDKQQHCLYRILFYFEQLQNVQLQYKDFILNIIEYNNNNNIQQMNINNQLFFGSVYALCKLIKDKFNIIVGIYMIQNSRELFPQQEYQLLLHKNHCVLTTFDQVKKIKIMNQYKKPYIMRNKNFQNKYIKKQKQKEIIPEIVNYYIDTETYILSQDDIQNIKDQNKGKQAIYLICIIDQFGNKWEFHDKQCITQFIEFIDTLIQKHSQQTVIIWSFNGGKFDYLFLMIDLLYKYSQLSMIGTETDIKQIQIDNIYFKDIKYIFSQGSLKQQAKMWGIQEQKQDFDIKNWTYQDYQNNEKFIKVLEYCYQDCIVLKGIVDKFYELVEFEYKNNVNNTKNEQLDMRYVFSSSSLTLTIFKQFYLQFDLQSNLNRNFYNIERESYYGGMTLNFIKEGKDLYYYDINSSYPNVMKNCKVPIAPLNEKQMCQYNQSDNQLDIWEIVPHYLYEVEVQFDDNCKITTLPIRTKDGLIYLKNVPKSWRWGCELIFIRDWNLQKNIKFYRYLAYKAENIFGEFIEDLYNKRLNTQRSDLKQFYKNLMNGGYGKFGQKEFPTNEFIHESNLEEQLRNPLIRQITQINNEIYKIGYAEKNNLQFTGSLVRIASFITAMSRVNLLQGMYTCGTNNIYYCDTDSIISSQPLPQEMIGNKLGQWKLENQIKQGIFVAPKIYYIQLHDKDKDGKDEYMKCKGIRNDILTKQIFDQLQDKKYIELTNIGTFTRKFGGVFIADQQKLVRILDLKRKWYNNQISEPYQDIDEYNQDKLIKQEVNEDKLLKKKLEKQFENDPNKIQKVQQRLEKKYKNQYTKIINDDSEVNQKRNQQYLNDYQNINEYIQKKVFQ